MARYLKAEIPSFRSRGLWSKSDKRSMSKKKIGVFVPGGGEIVPGHGGMGFHIDRR